MTAEPMRDQESEAETCEAARRIHGGELEQTDGAMLHDRSRRNLHAAVLDLDG
jgi:hypothetical protein